MIFFFGARKHDWTKIGVIIHGLSLHSQIPLGDRRNWHKKVLGGESMVDTLWCPNKLYLSSLSHAYAFGLLLYALAKPINYQVVLLTTEPIRMGYKTFKTIII